MPIEAYWNGLFDVRWERFRNTRSDGTIASSP